MHYADYTGRGAARAGITDATAFANYGQILAQHIEGLSAQLGRLQAHVADGHKEAPLQSFRQ